MGRRRMCIWFAAVVGGFLKPTAAFAPQASALLPLQQRIPNSSSSRRYRLLCAAEAPAVQRPLKRRGPARPLITRRGPVGPAEIRKKKQVRDDDDSDDPDYSLSGRWLAAGGPAWATLLDEFLFFFGSCLFVVGSFQFFPGTPLPLYVIGCELFIAGSAIFLGLALFNALEIWDDARRTKEPLGAFVFFEEFLYIVGSSLFLAGTVLFIPPLDSTPFEEVPETIPEVLSEVLSVPWFGVKTIEVVVRDGSHAPTPLEASVAQADVLFILGSVLFSVAAFVSALDAVSSSSDSESSALKRKTAVAAASMYELGGVAFIVGTLGFIPAEVMGIAQCPDGTERLTSAGAALFVVGSVLYCLGSGLTFAVTTYLTYTEDEDEEEDECEPLPMLPRVPALEYKAADDYSSLPRSSPATTDADVVAFAPPSTSGADADVAVSSLPMPGADADIAASSWPTHAPPHHPRLSRAWTRTRKWMRVRIRPALRRDTYPPFPSGVPTSEEETDQAIRRISRQWEAS